MAILVLPSRTVIGPILLAAFFVLGPSSPVSAVDVFVGSERERPQQPQGAMDEQGVLHVAFGVGDSVRYCRSTDGGASFSNAIELPRVGVLSLGMRRGPRIAATEGHVCVTAIAGKQGKGRDGDLHCWRSDDGGKSWESPVQINDVGDSAREGLHGMAGGPNGLLCCVWLDLRHGKTEVMASTSKDGGATWSKNVVVYQSPDGSVCECCHPSVVVDSAERIHVLWRNSLQGNRDMYVASSQDGGETFGDVKQQGVESWPLQACPMDGGAVAALTDGEVATVWRREKSVYLCRGDAIAEQVLGEGEQPWIAAGHDGPYVVWLQRRGGRAVWCGPGFATPQLLAGVASDPVVVASNAVGGPVVALWESKNRQGFATIESRVLSNDATKVGK